MNLLRHKQSQAGFSLLEMLIVLAISSILFATVFWSMTFQQLTTQRQSSMANIYDNQRFAMDTVTRYVRQAAYNLNQPKFFLLGAVSSAFLPIVHDNGIIRGTDSLIIRYADDDEGCPSLSLKGCGPAGNDDKTCPAINSMEFGILGEIDPCWETKCAGGPGGNCAPPFKVLIIDPLGENASIVTLSKVQMSAAHLQHDEKLCPSPQDCNYPAGSQIVMVDYKEVLYRLDYNLNTDLGTACYTPVPGHPRLVMIENYAAPDPAGCDTTIAGGWRKIIPLATDVEDFQIACAIDKDADGLIDDLDGSNSVSEGDYSSKLSKSDQKYVRSVRISMGFRSSDQQPRMRQGFPPVIEDHVPSGNAMDGYMRKTISTRIKIRNLAQSYR